MRKNLLKMCMVAIGLAMGTTGAWAEEVELNPTADTYLDWTSDDTKATNYGSATDLKTGGWQEMWTDKTPGLKSYGESQITLMKFNVKDYKGKITSATLSFTGYNGDGKARSIGLAYFDDNSWEESTVTANNAGMNTRGASLNIHPLNTYVSLNAGKTLTYSFSNSDLVNYLNNNADENGDVSLVIYGTRLSCTVYSKESDNKPVLKLEYSNETFYTATFTEQNGLTPEVTIYSDEACTQTVANGMLATNTTYYYKAVLEGYDDYTDKFTVGTENPAVSFTMKEKAKVTYSVNLVDESGTVLKTVLTDEAAYVGKSLNVSYPKYITDDNGQVTYTCTESYFNKTITVGEGASYGIKYNAYDGVAFFYEGEDLGIGSTKTENSQYSSNSAIRGIKANSTVWTVDEDGVYNLTLAVCSNNTNQTTTLTVNKGDTELKSISISWSVNYVRTTGIQKIENVKLAKGTTVSINPSSTNAILDYALIEKVSSTVTVSSAQYATYATNYNVVVPESGVKVYTVKVNDEGKAVEKTEVAAGTVIPAGTGILVSAEEGSYDLSVTSTEGTALTDNDLVAATSDVTSDGASYYALAQKDGKVGFALVATDVVIPAGKAYLKVENASGAKFISMDGELTAIEGIEPEQQNADGAYYTLQGVKMQKLAKGLYIHNGKKVVVK